MFQEPDPFKIAQGLALVSPDIALAFLELPREPLDQKCIVTFDTLAKEQPTPAQSVFDTNCDLVVYDQMYTVDRPNYLNEDPQKFVLDLSYQAKPYLETNLQMVNCDTRLFTDQYQPVETVFRNPQGGQPSACCVPYYVPRNAYMRVQAQSTRTINEGEVPVILTLVFKCVKLPAQSIMSYRNMKTGDVVTQLATRHNLWVPRKCGPFLGTVGGVPDEDEG